MLADTSKKRYLPCQGARGGTQIRRPTAATHYTRDPARVRQHAAGNDTPRPGSHAANTAYIHSAHLENCLRPLRVTCSLMTQGPYPRFI